MLLISTLILGLSAQVFAQAASTITAAPAAATTGLGAAASTTFSYDDSGDCTNWDAYDSCYEPQYTACANLPLTSQMACDCNQAEISIACWNSLCNAPTATALSLFLADSSIMCDGKTPTGSLFATTTTSSKGAGATVAGTTSKAAADRAMVAKSGPLFGGLGIMTGIMGLFF